MLFNAGFRQDKSVTHPFLHSLLFSNPDAMRVIDKKIVIAIVVEQTRRVVGTVNDF